MRSVDRLLSIIETLARYPKGMQVVKLAGEVGLPAGTTHRMLTKLRELGYVQQDTQTKVYSLGLKMFSLAAQMLNSIDLRDVSAPHLRRLVELTGVNPILTVYDYQQQVAICVDTIGSGGQIKFFVGLGKVMPLHCSATGKVIAAFLPSEKQDGIFVDRDLERYTEHTCTDPQKLQKEWIHIQRTGFAVCDEEMELGVAAIAAPIWDATDQIIGSVGVVGMRLAFNPPEKERIAQLVVSAGIAISETLGASMEKFV